MNLRTTVFCLFTLFSWCHFNAFGQTSDFTTIMDRIYANFQASGNQDVDAQVVSLTAALTAEGSWPDIDYGSTAQSNWVPGDHLARIAILTKAYSRESSAYYNNSGLKSRIIDAFNYWLGLSPEPNSTNWFFRTISVPKDIGNALICLRKSGNGITPELENQLIGWMTKGTPINQSPARDGSNLTDVAQHYIMRACLTENQELLGQTITAVANSIVVASTGEGIQADHSFTAHGPQLYVYGYGNEYISGISNIAVYVAGTDYAISADKMAIFSGFVRKGFVKPSRGAYADFNLFGRGITRVNNGRANVNLIERVRNIDLPEHQAEYDAAIQRMRSLQPPSYQVSPEHIHYWRTDYTVHHRPGYMVGLRSVSTRTVKSEMGNGENIKGHYLTDGVTSIAVKGDEYFGIYPVWEWNKIPGTTVPEITTFPSLPEWGANPGKQAFVGGVSDGVYGASAYAMNDYNTQARKGWFFFDNEVVCLGAGITSTAAQPINTTVNQSLLRTDVTISDGTQVSTLTEGERTYEGTLRWAWQDDVGYYFPDGGTVALSNQEQTGSWYSINRTTSSAPVATDVFKLWFKHGAAPANATYAYMIVPGKTAAEMESYNAGDISILSNTSSLQAVKHSTLGVMQAVFFAPGTVTDAATGLKIETNTPCAMVVKSTGANSVQIWMADPAQSATHIGLRITFPGAASSIYKNVTLPAGDFKGSSKPIEVAGTDPDDPIPVNEPAAYSVVTIADAYVRNGTAYQNTNYGSETGLVVKNDAAGYARETFIKFDLHGMPSNLSVSSMMLRLYRIGGNTTASTTNWQVYLVPDDNWQENTISWSNKPAGGDLVASIQGASGTGFTEWNVGSALTEIPADSILTFRIVSTAFGSTTDASFNSKEVSVPERRPMLFMAYKTVDIQVLADAFVRDGSAYENVNYGSQATLVVKNDAPGYAREAFLKFDLRGLPDNLPVSTMKLRLFRTSGNTTAGNTNWEVYLVPDNAWQEAGITWSNKPAGGNLLASIQGASGTGYTEWNVGPALTEIPADSILTFRIVSTALGSSTDATFGSKETPAADRRPVLSFTRRYTTYRSSGNVDLASAANWQVFDGSRWITADEAPSGIATSVLVRAGHEWKNNIAETVIPEGVVLTDSSSVFGIFSDARKLTNNGTIVWAATTVQAIPVAAGLGNNGSWGDLIIANPAGVTVDGDLVCDTLTLEKGKLTLSNSLLSAESISGGDPDRYVVTSGTSALKLPVAGSPVIFPVGHSAASYTPLSVVNTGTPDRFAVRVLAALPEGVEVADPGKVLPVSWEISEETAGGSSVTITFRWDPDDAAPVPDFTSATGGYVIGHHTGTGWDKQLVTISGSDPYTATNTTPFTSFSPFVVAVDGALDGNALPVRLVSFTAKPENTVTHLSWATAAEEQFSHFEPERSTDGRRFERIGSVPARGAEGGVYSFADKRGAFSLAYYRLKMVDTDGSYGYSDIVAVPGNRTSYSTEWEVYPNPAMEHCTIRSKEPFREISVYNAAGNKVREIRDVNDTTCTFSLTGMPSGIYLLRVTGDGFSITRMVVRQ